MKRRLLNVLTALSLLLCVAVAAVWVRSYFIGDWVVHRHLSPLTDGVAATDWILWSGRGSAAFSVTRFRWGAFSDWTPELRGGWTWRRVWPPDDPTDTGPLTSRWNRIGFGARWEAAPAGTYDRFVAVPMWLLFLFVAAAPCTRAYHMIRRHPPGRCKHCGYDLRATPGRCPECGAPAPVESAG